MIRRLVCVALALLSLAAAARADVRLPAVFSDHMVLQRDRPLRVWGWARAGERVAVTIAGRTAKTETDADGRWSALLPPLKAGGPYRMTVRGDNTLHVEDVLVGEVWLCSGQSNMEFAVSGVVDAKEEIAAADDDQVRHFKVPHVAAGTPYDDVSATWQVCSPQTAGGFTACGWFMARELRRRLHVPVGLVNVSWGGTRIEPWIPLAGLRAVPSLDAIAQQAEDAAGQKPRDHQQPTVLFNGMVNPLVGYPLRGVIWYQGESNLGDGGIYTDKMRALIEGWRTLWGSADLPFHYVQIAPYTYRGSDPTLLPALWEAQSAVEKTVSGTGMVVTNDIATLDDIHPPNKQDVGLRLALLALSRVYGKRVSDSGPVFREMTQEDGALRVSFDHADGGLKARGGGPLTHFEVAGATGGFVPADAKIDGDSVVLTAKDVPQPLAMRFAWHQLAQPNLVNGAGLPASAFRAGELPRPDFLGAVEEARDYALVYDIDLANLSAAPRYDVDAAAGIDGAFDRVAYLLELRTAEGAARWVWVSMDAFTDDARKLGIPTLASGAEFQQAAAHVNVASNVAGVETGEGLAGRLEMWPGNYGARNAAGVEGASDELWDCGDDPVAHTAGYGSMQVHALPSGRTLFAVNHWSAGGAAADIGIGSSALDPRCTDWTFARNGGSYLHKRLRVFVRRAGR